jgi:hypothetical protein
MWGHNRLALRRRFYVLIYVLFFAAGLEKTLLADVSDAVSAPPPTMEVKESSRPVFDPELFKNQPKKSGDTYLSKLRKKRAKFTREQQEERSEFFRKLRAKGLTSEKRQRRIAKFHQKHRAKLQKFTAKQQKKIQKHTEERS